jgi:hypothetical protein
MTTSTEEKSTTKQFLKGEKNYDAWRTRVDDKIIGEGFMVQTSTTNTINGQDIVTQTVDWSTDFQILAKARLYLKEHIDDSIMFQISGIEHPRDILAKLQYTYGIIIEDPVTLKHKCYQLFFPPTDDPRTTLSLLDKRKHHLHQAKGSLSPDEEVGILIQALQHQFWNDCRGQIKLRGLHTWNTLELRLFICTYWHAYKPNHWPINHGSAKTPKLSANHANSTPRHCDWCQENKGETRTKTGGYLYATHDTAKCQAGGNSGSNFSSTKTGSNKTDKNYLDSCANGHFCKTKPNNFTATKGAVYGPGGERYNILGSGETKVGKLTLKQVFWVPDFERNLISATKLLKEGYRIEMEASKFDVVKQGQNLNLSLK